MVLWVIRALFVLMIASLFMYSFGQSRAPEGISDFYLYQITAIISCMTIGTVGLLVDFLSRRKSVIALAGVFFGLVVGLTVGLAFNYIVDLMYEAFQVDPSSGLGMSRNLVKGCTSLLCCYLAIVFIMQTKDDFRFIIPYVEFSKQTKGNCPLILDTSVIIDGRIADIATTKILSSPLVIPRFILNELQNVADSPDRLRRNRGRRGLDILNKMQKNDQIDLTIQEVHLTPAEQAEPVDHQLVTTALKLSGRVVTNDYNLNKVARLRGVEVVNINDLANALRPVVLPGEKMQVKMVRGGDQPGQGVGYLDDGTMIVGEGGGHRIGQEVELVITSVLQTSAGRMIFGRMEDEGSGGVEEGRGRSGFRSRSDNGRGRRG